ncbi:MAG: peptidylprolyl isomerase [Planctomycetaceae bacterium]|nr:peptidylprolyl isomerase [Planctomycetaceae bacterium]
MTTTAMSAALPPAPSPLIETAIQLGSDNSVSLLQFLGAAHRRGRLLPLLREAVVEELIRQQADLLGLSVSDARLQQAADVFRRRRGLVTAAKTHEWLASQRLTVADWQQLLEEEMLEDQVREHLFARLAREEFAAHPEFYERCTLRMVVVAREDLAQELLLQLIEEDRDFATLAEEHSLHASRSRGGLVESILVTELPGEIRDAVCGEEVGRVIGPVSLSEGFCLVRVETRAAAVADRATLQAIELRMFEEWIQEQVSAAGVTFPLLDVLT